ncbi:ROK family transcriptional regulator [Amycolatopsis carbonis]|uniref:ROK family transcriptional regulator n=1 Tax=Amycolatopsis carbonis TaxID=715471 RepID=A0A9Y2IQF5_9PSEU|nr:ROK family transcriptional regulator [Amycolatopsis sp. 2-15]WIX84062.1 ROK family transcriptional regulator [Amycolatopsis sp. 2-15]
MSSGYLLWLVRTGKARTRADLQQHTGLSRSTVQQRLKPLFDCGYLRSHGTEDSTGGRPSVLLEFTDDGVVLVADLDTADARLAVVDLDGRRLAEERIALEVATGPVPVLDALDARFRALLEQTGRPPGHVRGIGVGVPGPVEFETGTVRQPPIMPGWDGYPIADHLAGRWAVPVLVDNDANIMALGEHTQQYPESSPLVLVKVSAGIGSGLVFNGGLLRGVDGGAGDIGHIRLPGHDDAVCMCGSRGCLAAVASGGALARRLTERGVPTRSSRELAAHLAAGRPEAVELAREAGRLVGEVLTTVVCMVNPEVLVIAGDLADTHFVTGVREVIYQKALPRATRHLQVTSSSLGDLAGLHGAQAMVLDAAYAPAAVDERLAREGAS